jgi:hypothetical protein
VDELFDQLLTAVIVAATATTVVTAATATAIAATPTAAAARTARTTTARFGRRSLNRRFRSSLLGLARGRFGNRRRFRGIGVGFVALLVFVLHS